VSAAVEIWGQTPDKHDILLVTLTNGRGLTAKLTNLGASILELHAPDKNGQTANLSIRHPNATDYIENHSSLGAICGRFANRIKAGRFELDGKTYQLAVNNGPNHLHGGKQGFNKRMWTAAPTAAEDGVTFRYRSLDGEENYPGNLDVAVTYRLTQNDELVMDYEAACDAPTVLNLTNHNYWTLGGVGSGVIDDHEIQIFGDKYLAADADDMVTGVILPVVGTPFDFTTPRKIGLHIGETRIGFDHCYVLSGAKAGLNPAATVRDAKSGRVMEVFTTEPAVQFYTANYFNGTSDSAGHKRHEAFCLECQHFPDSPNHPQFPTTTLRPGQVYRQTTLHRFSVV
jgi:aldose 1-epimerase